MIVPIEFEAKVIAREFDTTKSHWTQKVAKIELVRFDKTELK